ncbi:membrane protein insertion efficiency factor YidD [Herbiconiux sp. CPCC 205716]|uniref:Putative membrane protein insertion efficiency factor n=2 Tax=Herbiconiux gentiana TaxID=2970912 RepID=A0ABT2GLR7_9MICO|nr:membrane protein insertion efficiency factor YidD [Herbiconiux gentiana]MCS5715879.1 membrane protein insertion efficiency factor YidD [Herbiconiux gentiana]
MMSVVTAIVLLPRNLAVLLLRAYRAVISPLYGDVCRYYPSCSSYTLQAIQQRGVVVGSAMGVYRIARCHPWAKGGVDDVPPARRQRYRLTPFGFVIPASHGKG